MKHIPEYFKNASFTLCGATSFLLLAQYILREVGSPGWLPVTGLGYVTCLCWHVLFFWAGMLLRQFLPRPRWWIQLPVLAVAVFFLTRYQHYSATPYWTLPYLYFAVFGLGYIFPPKMLERLRKESGGIDFALLLASIFCCVAVTVSGARINWGSVFSYQYRDMERLIEWLLSVAEPLMVLLVAYFAARVSFSKEGLWLGSRPWFQTAATIAAAFLFLASPATLLPGFSHRWVELLRFLVQPISLYLIIISARIIMKLICREKYAETTWQEIVNI